MEVEKKPEIISITRRRSRKRKILQYDSEDDLDDFMSIESEEDDSYSFDPGNESIYD